MGLYGRRFLIRGLNPAAQKMLGAILGDIAGSPWTGSACRDESFVLMPPNHTITGESLAALATAEAVLEGAPLAATFRRWSDKFPEMCLGGTARATAIGWLAQSLDEAQVLGRATARAAKESFEGVRTAEALAGAIWLARRGLTADQLSSQIHSRYRYTLGRSMQAWADVLPLDSAAFDTVTIGFDCALQASSTEEAIRRAIHIGGDTGGSAAIAGAVAEARFGLPKHLARDLFAHIPQAQQRTIAAVYARAGAPIWRDAQPKSVESAGEGGVEVMRPATWLMRLKTRVQQH